MNQVESSTPPDMPAETRKKLTEIFNLEEIRWLNQRSDAMGFLGIAFTWGVVAGTLAMLAWVSSRPLYIAIPAFAIGLCVLAGRHLGLAILHHEAAHRTLFETRWLNDFMGDWFCARPTWNDLPKYRANHFIHHRKTNQPDDPDLSLVAPFPTTKASLRRKLTRDVLGLTGLKYLFGRVMMDLEIMKWTVANDIVRLPRDGRSPWSYVAAFVRNSWGMFLTNGILYALCRASGHGWLYGMWVLSYVTPYPLFLRIRSMAEHAVTDRGRDMFTNTRTTRAGFIARATVAPVRVNFHIEHHVMPSAPYFRLPAMHRMLVERGAISEPPTYGKVLQLVTEKVA